MASPDNFSIAAGTRAAYGGRNASTRPSWVSSLALFQAYEIPNTAFSLVPPSPTPAGFNGPSAKVGSWCGNYLRRANSEYGSLANGGHTDYTGNEGDRAICGVEVPYVEQHIAPSAAADVQQQTPVYKDGRRAALHSYYSLQYDNQHDRIRVFSSGSSFGNGALPDAAVDWPYPSGTPVVMAFDRATNAWLDPDTLARNPSGASGAADFVCQDPTTGDVYYNKGGGSGTLYKYTNATNTWSAIGSWFMGGYAGSAVDFTRNRILAVGSFNGDVAPTVRSTINASAVAVTFGGLGPSVLTVSGYPGVVYDEANDNFLVFMNGVSSIDIYRVDAATFFVDKPTLTGVALANRPNGIQNSPQYAPGLGGVLIANSYTGNIKFIRTHL